MEATGVLESDRTPAAADAWVNNKVAFMETVQRLFGREWVPALERLQLGLLAKNVRELANRGRDRVEIAGFRRW